MIQMANFRASGLQGFRASGLQGFRASGLQGFRAGLVLFAIWLCWGWENSQAATFVSPDISDFNKATLDGQTAVGASVSTDNPSFTSAGNFFVVDNSWISSPKVQLDFGYIVSPNNVANINDALALTSLSIYGIEAGVFTEIFSVPFSSVTNRDGNPIILFKMDRIY